VNLNMDDDKENTEALLKAGIRKIRNIEVSLGIGSYGVHDGNRLRWQIPSGENVQLRMFPPGSHQGSVVQ